MLYLIKKTIEQANKNCIIKPVKILASDKCRPFNAICMIKHQRYLMSHNINFKKG